MKKILSLREKKDAEGEIMVSIIVPVYNAADFILETIKMVRAQSFQEWELILVDDASKDNSCKVVRNYLEKNPDPRIRLIAKEENEGAALTRNRGIREAKGPGSA